MVKNRENNYDLLRTVCAIMIVLLHVGAFYEQSDVTFYAQLGTFLQAITRTAVPCFVMLSGAFLLGNPKWSEYTYALPKTKKAILRPMILYSVVFVLLSCVTYALGASVASYKEVFLLALQGYPYPHMWYMFMTLGLYLATPLIWQLKRQLQNISHKCYVCTVFVLLVLGVVIQATSNLIWIIQFVPYIGYFMFGDLVRNHYMNRNSTKLSWLFLCLWLVAIGFSCWKQLSMSSSIPSIGNVLDTDPLNAIIAVASTACFAFFSSIKVPFSTWNFSKHTLRIYLVHIIVLQVVKELMKKINGRIMPPLIGVPLMTVLGVGLPLLYSIFVEKIYARLQNKKAARK